MLIRIAAALTLLIGGGYIAKDQIREWFRDTKFTVKFDEGILRFSSDNNKKPEERLQLRSMSDGSIQQKTQDRKRVVVNDPETLVRNWKLISKLGV